MGFLVFSKYLIYHKVWSLLLFSNCSKSSIITSVSFQHIFCHFCLLTMLQAHFYLIHWQNETSFRNALPAIYRWRSSWMCINIFTYCFLQGRPFCTCSCTRKIRVYCCIHIDICFRNWRQGDELTMLDCCLCIMNNSFWCDILQK